MRFSSPMYVLVGVGWASACGTSPSSGELPLDAGEVDVSTADAAPLDVSTGTADSGPFEAAPPGPGCTGAVKSQSTPGAAPTPPAIKVPPGFKLEAIATIGAPRELAALPNGDLIVGTNAKRVYLIPNAEGDPGTPLVFAEFAEGIPQGVAFAPATCTLYVSTSTNIYAMAYADGQTSGDPKAPIAHVRTGPISPGTDGDVHTTTSVALARGALYAGVGSSCNACTETDPTRATVQRMDPSGANMATYATRFRNPIALIENPATGTLWAGGAGQDGLVLGHPYEFFDAVSMHPAVADYGWPECEENQHAYTSGADCSKTIAPLIEFPAYSTLIGAAFYPASQKGAHVFPDTYKGGVFITAHGSWHTEPDGTYFSPPRVAYVPMNGDTPKTPVNWSDPSAQWTDFVSGCQSADGKSRIARPAGIAVGSEGSLFVSEDQTGYVFRIRPTP